MKMHTIDLRSTLRKLSSFVDALEPKPSMDDLYAAALLVEALSRVSETLDVSLLAAGGVCVEATLAGGRPISIGISDNTDTEVAKREYEIRKSEREWVAEQFEVNTTGDESLHVPKVQTWRRIVAFLKADPMDTRCLRCPYHTPNEDGVCDRCRYIERGE